MTQRKKRWWVGLLVGAWLVAAVAGIALMILVGPPTGSGAPASAPSPTEPGSSLPNPAVPVVPHKTGPSESVVLAYDPSDGSLLKADREGLLRWHAGSGWENIDISQTFGLSGVVANPGQPVTIYSSGPELGVIRSDDGGANWRAVNNGLPGLDVTALALHSFRHETLYAWVRDDGIYRTEDGGANWKRMPDQGPPDKNVRGLMHSTLEGSMNTGWLYASTPTGAYLSMDCF